MLMNIWAVIPKKPIREAKSNLAEILTQDEQQQLAWSLFQHTITQLTDWHRLQGILVISADQTYLKACDQTRIHFLQEDQPNEINTSLNFAIRHLTEKKPDAILVIRGDLPLLSKEALLPLIEQTPIPGIGIVGDRHQRRTNILLASPPNILPFCFGENSFMHHQLIAQERNVPTHITLSAPLSLDIDTPADFLFFKKLPNHSGFNYETN